MGKSPRKWSSGSTLFVVRIWCDDSTDQEDRAAGEAGTPACQGRVQRAISGEARDFQGWPALIAALEGMLTAARPVRKTGARRDENDSGDT